MHPAAPLGRDRVLVWLIRADLPAPHLAALESVLDAEERGRAEALHQPLHRQRFVAAHAALRMIVGRRVGIAPAEIKWCRGEHGKPALVGNALQVNLSHSGELAAVAVARQRPVGVDVERCPDEHVALRLASRYYPSAEAEYVSAALGPGDQARRFARLWTRKEACVKAAGGRLFHGLRLPVQGECCAAGLLVRDPEGDLPGPFVVRDLPAPRGFRAAVALGGIESYRVTTRWWWPAAVQSGQPTPVGA